jgi:hypothetical protein
MYLFMVLGHGGGPKSVYLKIQENMKQTDFLTSIFGLSA